jgi:hypothetical protein
MATLLSMAQKVALESGTFSGTQINAGAISGMLTTCQNQVGRLAKVVSWTIDAWTEIQNKHSSWRWMRQPLPETCVTSANIASYSPTAWGITDFASWIIDPHEVTLYNQSLGVADEGEITFKPWPDFRRSYMRGLQTPNRPGFFSISPQMAFCPGPIPDQAYVICGEYQQTPQILALDTDVPNCPARFHDAIVWLAVLRLCQHDEGEAVPLAAAQYKFNQFMDGLERDQLPEMVAYSGPLA